jgi:hypothetical protein
LKHNARVIKYCPIKSGHPAFILIGSHVRKDPIGWAFIVGDDNYGCLIGDIWVDPKFRRQGFGLNMIHALQKKYFRVWTGMSTPEGRELCLKAGFVINKGMFKRDIPRLEWEAPDAKGDGRVPEEGCVEEGLVEGGDGSVCLRDDEESGVEAEAGNEDDKSGG